MTRWLESLPFGLTPEGAITAMAGLSAVLAVLALWLALTPRQFGAARARALVNRRAELKAAALAPRKRASLRSQDLMRQVVERLNLLRGLQADKLAQKLARAGYRSKEALIAMFFAKATVPALAAAVVAFMVMVLDIGQLSQRLQLLAVFSALAAGYFMPDLFVYNQATRRQAALRKSLPDGLDLMVICAEAGLSLDAALQRVARELGRASPEIGDEFALTAVELGFMPDRRRALENLSRRTGLAGLHALVGALVQTEKYGTPLAQSLRVLSAEQRNERIIRAEEKAARLPAIMTVPLVFFILPPLFIVLMGPAVLNIMNQFVNR